MSSRGTVLFTLFLFGPGCGGAAGTDATAPGTDAGTDAGSDAGGLDAGLPDGVWAFDGTDPAGPTDDLEPLWALVSGARVVGLGESVHTSGGFYAAKHRLIRWLVEAHGLRVLAMETPRSAAMELDQFLLSGPCDLAPDQVLDAIFGVFADDNTAALMRWLCERNLATPSDPVRFFGFDVQQPEQDYADIDAFLLAWAPADEPALYAELDTCHVTYDVAMPPAMAAYDACTLGLADLDSYLTSNEATLTAAAGAEGYLLMQLSVLGLRSWQDEVFYYASDIGASYESRDVAMATVFQSLLDFYYPTAPLVAMWAHNYHLAADHPAVTDTVLAGLVTTGTLLRAALGADYAPVALAALGAGINWPGVGMGPSAVGTEPGSLERRLDALGPAYLVADTAAAWLDPASPISFSDETMIVPDQYDAIVYLQSSPPMNAVFW